MKQVTINVYQLSELSENAKIKAHKKFLELDFIEFSIYDYDLYVEIIEENNLDRNLIHLINYDLNYRFINLSNNKGQIKLNSIISSYIYDNKQIIIDEIIQKYPFLNDLEIFDYLDNYYNTSSRSLNIDCEYHESKIKDHYNIDINTLDNCINDILSIINRNLINLLNKLLNLFINEYEYKTSFEYFQDISEANQWYYTVDGNFYKGDI